MRSKAAADIVESTEQEVKALELRRAGAGYRAIAKALNCSVAMAHKYVARAMKRLTSLCEEQAAEVRTLELDRLDAMLMGLWPNATKGNPQAVAQVLRIMERRATMLGIDSQKSDQAPAAQHVLITSAEDAVRAYRSLLEGKKLLAPSTLPEP